MGWISGRGERREKRLRYRRLLGSLQVRGGGASYIIRGYVDVELRHAGQQYTEPRPCSSYPPAATT